MVAPSLLDRVCNFYRLAIKLLALVGCFHECKNLNRLLRLHGRHTCLEKFYDFHYERSIAVVLADLRFTLVAFGRTVKFAVLAEYTLASTFPSASDLNVSRCSFATLNSFAAQSHHRV